MWLLALVAAAMAEPLTLEVAIAEAMRANLEQQQQDLQLEGQRAALLAARSIFDPTLTASVSTGSSTQPNNTAVDGTTQLVTRSSGWSTSVGQALPTGGAANLAWSESYFSTNSQNVVSSSTVSDRVSLSISQPLLGGLGATMFGIRSSKLALSDEELAWRAAAEQLVLDVSSAYWRLVRARESRALALRSREIADQNVVDARSRYEEGFAGSGDLNQAERSLGSARQSEVIAVAEVEAADMALRRVLGRDVDPGIVLEPLDRPVVPGQLPGYDEVYEQAKQSNALWLRQQLALRRTELAVKQSRNGALPDLYVNGGVGWSGLAESASEARGQLLEGTNNDWSLGASMTVPLPGRAIQAGLRSATIDQESARLALQASEQELVLRVQAAVRAADTDRMRVELAEDTVRFARLALEADQELFREGKGSTRDMVISLEALDREQVALLQAQIDLQASLLELRRVAGTVLP